MIEEIPKLLGMREPIHWYMGDYAVKYDWVKPNMAIAYQVENNP